MRARGYILAETLVALIVLVLVVGAVTTVSVTSMRGQAVALQTRRALMIARSTLASVGVVVPGGPGTTTGVAGDIGWRVDVERVGAAGPLGTVVRVNVAAGPVGGRSRVTLSELRLAPAVSEQRLAPAVSELRLAPPGA